MTVLSRKTSDGRSGFKKYVQDNPKLNETTFEVEKHTTARIYIGIGDQIEKTRHCLEAGTKFNIISTEIYNWKGQRLAMIQIGKTKGFLPLQRIRKPTVAAHNYEKQLVDNINDFLMGIGQPINIRLRGSSKIYKDIQYAVAVSELPIGGVNPKADIILCKDKKRPFDHDPIFITHKKTGNSDAFHQYSGVSKMAGIGILNHPLTILFKHNMAFLMKDSPKLLTPVMMDFKDDKLGNLAIYGPKYGAGFSVQHCQVIGQGVPSFNQVKNTTFEMYFPDHMGLSGRLPSGDGYSPVFGATYRADRSFVHEGVRYSGVRLGIYPRSFMKSRPNLTILV
jgi:hypothetical protein